MTTSVTRRSVPSGRGVGFVKFETPGDRVMGIHRDVFQLDDNGKTRDNVVWEVTSISANVYNQKKLIPIETGDFVCIGMGPKTLNGRAKFMTEGKMYGIEYLGEGEAEKASHNPRNSLTCTRCSTMSPLRKRRMTPSSAVSTARMGTGMWTKRTTGNSRSSQRRQQQ